MEQTPRDRAKEAKEKRQEYLHRTSDAHQSSLFWGCTGLIFVAVAVVGFTFVLGLHARLSQLLSSTNLSSINLSSVTSLNFSILDSRLSLLWIVPVALAFLAVCAAGICKVKAKDMTYAPPVREPVAALPGDEVPLQEADKDEGRPNHT